MFPQAVSAKAAWGPDCSTGYNNTLSLWEQVGYGDWYHVYGESMPRVRTTAGNYYYMMYAWGCGGVGLWTVRAYIGGQYKWGNQIYCPT